MARPQKQQQPQSETEQQQLPQSETETPTQTQNQTQTQPQPQPQTTQNPSTKLNRLPLAILVTRVITLVSLIVSLIIITSNTATVIGFLTQVKFRFKDIYAYRYMVSCIVIGLAYTCLQVPFAIYQVRMGKTLLIHDGLPMFDFISDKVLLSLLATGVGAAFATTADLKKKIDDFDNYLEFTGDTSLFQLRSKLDNFFNMANMSAGFLLIAFLSSGGSSFLSSLSFVKRR